MGTGAWVVAGPVDLSAPLAQGGTVLGSCTELCAILAARGARRIAFDRFCVAEDLLDSFALAGVVADVLSGDPDDRSGLDPAAASAALGAYVELGRGRAASVAMRELTCLDQLAPGRASLVLAGHGARLAEAGDVAAAMLPGKPATAGGQYEWIDEAPNLPAPPTDLRSRIVLLDLGQLAARSLAGEGFRVRRATHLGGLGSLESDELVLLELPGLGAEG